MKSGKNTVSKNNQWKDLNKNQTEQMEDLAKYKNRYKDTAQNATKRQKILKKFNIHEGYSNFQHIHQGSRTCKQKKKNEEESMFKEIILKNFQN